MFCDKNFLIPLSVFENIYKCFENNEVKKIFILYYDKKNPFFAKGICMFNLISNP